MRSNFVFVLNTHIQQGRILFGCKRYKSNEVEFCFCTKYNKSNKVFFFRCKRYKPNEVELDVLYEFVKQLAPSAVDTGEESGKEVFEEKWSSFVHAGGLNGWAFTEVL